MALKKSPSIAIVVIAHDRMEFIARALESIENQITKPEEIIVVKNFSNEAIDNKILKMGAKNVFCEQAPEGDKINQVYKGLNSDFVCFLEDDDSFQPNKLTSIKSFMTDDISYIHHDMTIFDSNSIQVGDDFSKNIRHIKNTIKLDKNINTRKILNYQKMGISFNLSSICVRKDVLDGDWLCSVNTGIDNLLFIRAIGRGEVLHLPDRLTNYRYHHSNSLEARRFFFSNTINSYEKYLENVDSNRFKRAIQIEYLSLLQNAWVLNLAKFPGIYRTFKLLEYGIFERNLWFISLSLRGFIKALTKGESNQNDPRSR